MFFDLSYVIHVYIYLLLDKTQLSKEEMEPVLMQISKVVAEWIVHGTLNALVMGLNLIAAS